MAPRCGRSPACSERSAVIAEPAGDLGAPPPADLELGAVAQADHPGAERPAVELPHVASAA